MTIAGNLLRKFLTYENVVWLISKLKLKKRMSEKLVTFKKDDIVNIKVDVYKEKWKVIETPNEYQRNVKIQNKRFGGVKISVPILAVKLADE